MEVTMEHLTIHNIHVQFVHVQQTADVQVKSLLQGRCVKDRGVSKIFRERCLFKLMYKMKEHKTN